MSGRHGRHDPQENGSQAVLPARPDPSSGDPAPPSAPGYRGPELPSGHNPGADRRLGRRPSPPPRLGPVLSWYRPNVRGRIFRFVLALSVLVAGSAVLSLVRGDRLELLRAWPVWPVVLVGATLMARPFGAPVLSVGADWLQRCRRRRAEYVRLYELTRIEARQEAPVQLVLADAEQVMVLRLAELQPDRAAWDLVYNGILHSVAAGARIDEAAFRLLHLDRHPALEALSDSPGR
jgi:hypothetical protein